MHGLLCLFQIVSTQTSASSYAVSVPLSNRERLENVKRTWRAIAESDRMFATKKKVCTLVDELSAANKEICSIVDEISAGIKEALATTDEILAAGLRVETNFDSVIKYIDALDKCTDKLLGNYKVPLKRKKTYV